MLREPVFVLTGTLVADHINLPLLGRINVADMAYGHLERLGYPVEIIALPMLGARRLSITYHEVEEQIFHLADSKYSGRMVNLLGHSQGGLHAGQFWARHPERIHHAMAVFSPYHGTRSAQPWRWLVACAKDMAPESDFLRQLRDEIKHRAEQLHDRHLIESDGHLPQIHFIEAAHDGFVRPARSAVMHELSQCSRVVHNHCLAFARPNLPEGIEWRAAVSPFMTHLTEFFFRPLLGLLAEILAGSSVPLDTQVA